MGENTVVDEWTESELAWDLADTLAPLLPTPDRAAIYAKLGAGYFYTAITTLVQASARSGYPLPANLTDRLAEWLGPYAYSHDAARLQQFLKAIRTS